LSIKLAITHEVVKQFIYEVRVYSADRIEIVFNFADEYTKLQARLSGYKKIASA